MWKAAVAIPVTAVIGCAVTGAARCVAADYPERPVRLIVISAAGGGPDVANRIVAAELTRQLGKQFVVDNRPGASGVIGTEMIARATPDGYTIGNGNIATLAINRSILTKLPYDLDRDIQPVARTISAPNLLAVAPSLPVKSVKELMAFGRKNPGGLLFASSGNGTSLHLSGELFKRMTGTPMTHCPYKAAQQGITDMIAGQVHLMFDNIASIAAHAKAGRVRGVAVTASTRLAAFPELPTVAESGVPNFEVVTFGGIIAPAGVSKNIVNRLNAEVNKALAASNVKDKFDAMGVEPAPGTSEEFAAQIKREATKWAEVIKGANIKAD